MSCPLDYQLVLVLHIKHLHLSDLFSPSTYPSCPLYFAICLSFFALVHFFTLYSCRMASCFVGKYSILFTLNGPRSQVYFVSVPLSCIARRLAKSLVYPVYNVPSLHANIYTICLCLFSIKNSPCFLCIQTILLINV